MHRNTGMTLPEVLVVLAIIGLVLGAAPLMLNKAEGPLQSATSLFEGYLRQARARAMSTTSAYRIQAIAPDRLAAEWANDCDAGAWNADPQLTLELPRDVRLSDTAWTICFTTRGWSSDNQVFTLTHPRAGTARVELLLGGSTRVLP
jgi:type IV fimbrial biogenesis protein FimT